MSLINGHFNFNRGGFSWWRFLGVSQAKARVSRRIGIPLSRSGRQQKLGRVMGRLPLGRWF
jgi:hypothetical protein